MIYIHTIDDKELENLPANKFIDAIFQSKRNDFLVTILLADLIKHLQTGYNNKSVLRLDTFCHTRQDNVCYPFASLFQNDFVRYIP